MINEIKKLIQSNTNTLEGIINGYFNMDEALNANSFQQNMLAFAEEKGLTNLDKAKFKVYAKINKDLSNCNGSDAECKQSLNFYYPFLVNLYAAHVDLASNQERFKFAINNFIADIQKVTQRHIESPIEYGKHGTKAS